MHATLAFSSTLQLQETATIIENETLERTYPYQNNYDDDFITFIDLTDRSKFDAGPPRASPEPVDVDPEKPKPPNFWQRNKALFRRHWKFAQSLLPYVGLFSYIAIGAAVMLFVEKSLGVPKGPMVLRSGGCLSQMTYWTALFYANSLSTTVGYGTIYTCTALGQVISVIYAMLGIPLVLIVLNGLGNLLSKLIGRCYARLARCWRRRKDSFRHIRATLVLPAADDAELTTDVPIVLGIVLTLIWILVCASIFSYTEVWPFALSFYFTFLSLTTNNLGEVTPQRINLFVANVCIFMGLCLISMTIILNRVQSEIENAYKERLNAEEEGHALGPEVDPEQVVNEILQKYNAPWLAAMISSSQMSNLFEKVEEKAAMLNKEIQVERETETVTTSTSPMMQKDKETFALLIADDPPKVSVNDHNCTSPIRIDKQSLHFSAVLVQHFEIQPKQQHFGATPAQTESNAMQHQSTLCNLKPEVQSVAIECNDIPMVRQRSVETGTPRRVKIEQKSEECQASRATKENSSQTRQTGPEKQKTDKKSDMKQYLGGRWKL